MPQAPARTGSADQRGNRTTWLLAAAALLCAGTIGARASAPRSQTASQAVPPPQEQANRALEDEEAFAILGEETTEKVCSTCHAVEDVTGIRRTLRGWSDMVMVMASRGAVGTDQEFTTIKRYLTRYYGLVHVNTATPEELSAVLGLSAKDAAAVVEYRKVHGKFADIASVAKVNAAVKTRVDEQPAALRFD